MRLRLRLPSWLVRPPSVVDTIAPLPPEWDGELTRQHGVSEIMRGSRENLLEFQRRSQLESACDSNKPWPQTGKSA
jgi:hypothetical protein